MSQERTFARIENEFDSTTPAEPTNQLPRTFSSPLIDGLLQSSKNLLGPKAYPTPIQALSLKHLFKPLEEGNTENSCWLQKLTLGNRLHIFSRCSRL